MVFIDLRELYAADFHKPGIYASGRVWANAWDVSRRASSRGDRGRRAAVDFVVCFGCGGIPCFCHFFFFECTRLVASMRPPCLIYLFTSITTQPLAMFVISTANQGLVEGGPVFGVYRMIRRALLL